MSFRETMELIEEIEKRKKQLMEKHQLSDDMLKKRISDEHLLEIKKNIPFTEVGEFLPEMTSQDIDDAKNEGTNEKERRGIFVNM